MNKKPVPDEEMSSLHRRIRFLLSCRFRDGLDILVSLATLATITYGVAQYAIDRKDQAFSNDVMAWDLLSTSKYGNFGQRSAIELLARHGASMHSLQLDGVDLSSGDYRGIQLPNSYITNSNLTNSDLRKSYLGNAVFDNSDLSFANLSDSSGFIKSVRNVNFTGAILPIGTASKPTNLSEMAISHGCVNQNGPRPKYANGGFVAVKTICGRLPFDQAQCSSNWCDKKFSFEFYHEQ